MLDYNFKYLETYRIYSTDAEGKTRLVRNRLACNTEEEAHRACAFLNLLPTGLKYSYLLPYQELACDWSTADGPPKREINEDFMC